MLNNYEYSKELLHYCLEREIPFLYASSAATYGGRDHDFIEEKPYEVIYYWNRSYRSPRVKDDCTLVYLEKLRAVII